MIGTHVSAIMRRRAMGVTFLRARRVDLEAVRVIIRMVKIAIRDYRDYRRLVVMARKDLEAQEAGAVGAPGSESVDPTVLGTDVGPTEAEVRTALELEPEPGPEPEPVVFDLPREASLIMARAPFSIVEGLSGDPCFRLTPDEENGIAPFVHAYMKSVDFDPKQFKWIALTCMSLAIASTMAHKVGDYRKGHPPGPGPEPIEVEVEDLHE